MIRILLGIAAFTLLGAHLAAQEPKQPRPEKIPAPKVQPPPIVILETHDVRPGSRDVWQHYGVNRLGRFVPRVVVYPEGAYYSRDLQPYYFMQNRSSAVMPYVVD
jgi:hypothetical protein